MKIDGAALCNQLLEAGVPAGPIHDTAQVVAHPHTQHRDMNVQQDWYRMTGTPIKFSRTPGSLRRLPPRYGEHSREILLEYGLSQDAVQALVDAGVVLETRRRD